MAMGPAVPRRLTWWFIARIVPGLRWRLFGAQDASWHAHVRDRPGTRHRRPQSNRTLSMFVRTYLMYVGVYGCVATSERAGRGLAPGRPGRCRNRGRRGRHGRADDP